ncbi:cobalt-precorrin-5B C(1)-methyltransferase [Spirochaetia bacterium]|nr:cobalt-precorrin-5B C(1)-methyltransferase [Spirochaetia bacterium]
MPANENTPDRPELASRFVNGRLLRCGYTTGSCAAAAAGAATRMLLTQSKRETYRLVTPKGIALTLDILNPSYDRDVAVCAVKKDAGDDPDVTRGVLVYAAVRRRTGEPGIVIDGGEGVGRVTKPGLDQRVGNAAINSTPRRMIASECQAMCTEAGYEGGLEVTISIPGGAELALRTFNPRVGIVGGISVLGTSGMVEPMSEKAWADSLRLEMRQLFAAGRRDVLITIGNFAADFARDTLGLSLESQVKCQNFIGEALGTASELGFKRALLVGHLGKMVKLGIGMVSTHSSHGDGRIETLVICALKAGASLELLRGIADCVSTDAALVLLREAGLLSPVMEILRVRIEATMKRHSAESLETGFVCFGKAAGPEYGALSRDGGEVVSQSANAASLMEVFRL